MKAIQLTKLCSKCKVDIRKNWSSHEILFRRSSNSIELTNKFVSKILNMEPWDSDLSDNMCFVKIIKGFDNTFWTICSNNVLGWTFSTKKENFIYYKCVSRPFVTKVRRTCHKFIYCSFTICKKKKCHLKLSSLLMIFIKLVYLNSEVKWLNLNIQGW